LDGVFQGCNQIYAKTILGLTRDRIIGRRAQQLPDSIPPDLAATYQRQELKMLEKTRAHTFEAQVRCCDGIRRDFLFSTAPILDETNEISGIVTVLVDLTEKNRAAQDRIQKEKLEGVLETAGAVCHEFNQPLQALSGYSELIQPELKTNEAAVRYLHKITEQIDRMSTMTAKLQKITRYETMDYANKTRIIDIHKASE
jgi:PAS domain S-box-containing protein